MMASTENRKGKWAFKETRSVTMFKSFVKIELSYVFTINMFSIAESCMEQ